MKPKGTPLVFKQTAEGNAPKTSELTIHTLQMVPSRLVQDLPRPFPVRLVLISSPWPILLRGPTQCLGISYFPFFCFPRFSVSPSLCFSIFADVSLIRVSSDLLPQFPVCLRASPFCRFSVSICKRNNLVQNTTGVSYCDKPRFFP